MDKHGLHVVNCMGNPRVFLAVPTPVLVAGFPVETSPRSSKTVKYWVSYEQNNQIDHKPLNIYLFWMIQGSFWSSWVQESIPVPVPRWKPTQNLWVYPYPCNTLATCPLPPHLKHWTELSADVPFVAGALSKVQVAVRKGPPPLCPPSCRDSSFKRQLITELTLSSLRGAVSSETMREE